MAKITKYINGGSYYLKNSGDPVNVECIYEKQIRGGDLDMIVIKTRNPNSKNGGISQTIHFTKDSAKQLIDIFEKNFNLKN